MMDKPSRPPFRPLIFGEALFDHFPDGSRVLGGAPFNVAWHLQGFKARPLILTSVGRDPEGKEILERMTRWGMDTRGVQEHPTRRTGRVTAHLKGGSPSYEIEPGQAFDAIAIQDLPPDPVLSEGDLLYHGTLALREETSRRSLVYLRDRYRFPTLVDVNLRAPWWRRDDVLERMKGTAWVKLNREEAEFLGQATADGPGELEEAGNQFRQSHEIDHLIMTLGEEGSLALTPRDRIRQKAARIQGEVDSVGAGDAFAAVLLLGVHQGWPLPQTLERASAFAGDICRIRGATTDDPEMYSRHLRSWGHAS